MLRTVIVVMLAGLGATACGSAGSSSSDPNTLLKQTFTGTHKVTSGVLNLTLTIDAAGSSTLNGPITVSFGGPFQTRGSGQLPQSNFTVSASALGRSVSLGIISTGTNGYVTLQGTSYQMPAATFQKLESSFGKLSPTGSSSGATLSKLGIHPLTWLSHPTVVGTEKVGGAQTTHIHAGVNVPAFLNDLNTAVATSGAAKSGLPASARQQITAAVRNPGVDVWTGESDKTIRRLTVAVTLAGKAASALGGARSADIGLTLQYANLNEPQKITAPGTVRPFSEFQQKVAAFVQALQGAAGGVIGSGGASSSGGTSPNTGTSTGVQKYSQCIQQAAGDVAKMQNCAALLGSGG